MEVFCPDIIPSNYLFFREWIFFKTLLQQGKERAGFILDCSDLRRLNNIGEKILQLDKIVNNDHHITNEKFGDVNLIDASAASTGKLCIKYYSMIMSSIMKSAFVYMLPLVPIPGLLNMRTQPLKQWDRREATGKGINPFYVSQKIFDEYPIYYFLIT